MEIITKSAEETLNLGKNIGSSLKGGEILALVGELGAGKTTFIQGLAKGLGIKNKIVSPTFILMRSYKEKFNFYHLDLYRLENNVENEVRELGLFDIWKRKENIIAIEWSEKIENLLSDDTIFITFKNTDENERKIIIKNFDL